MAGMKTPDQDPRRVQSVVAPPEDVEKPMNAAGGREARSGAGASRYRRLIAMAVPQHSVPPPTDGVLVPRRGAPLVVHSVVMGRS